MTAPRIFYGWYIVLAAFVVDFVAVGFFFYSYGVFFLPIAEELGGGSRFGVSLGITLSNAVAASLAPWIGNALDRFPIKRIQAIGVCITSVGFLLLSGVQSMLQFYLVLVCFTAVGIASMGQLATAKLVSNWFVAKRGTALGIATMGISLSGMAMPPITTWLIFQFGWRGSLEIFSLATFLILMPVIWLLVVNTPEEKNLEPDGRKRLHLPDGEPRAPEPAVDWRDILSRREFWSVTITIGLTFCGMGAMLTNIIPLANDLGIADYNAAFCLSAGALAGVLGKVFFGVLSDRANGRMALLFTIGTQWIGIAMISTVEQFWTLAVACTIFGFGMGGVVPLHGVMIGKLFGRREFGKVMGLSRPMMLPLQSIGLPWAGFIHDSTGSYNIAFYTFLTFLIIAALIAIFWIPEEGARRET